MNPVSEHDKQISHFSVLDDRLANRMTEDIEALNSMDTDDAQRVATSQFKRRKTDFLHNDNRYSGDISLYLSGSGMIEYSSGDRYDVND